MKILILIILLLVATNSYSQSDDKEWDLDSLKYDPNDFKQDVYTDMSSGFFPRILDNNGYYWNIYYNHGYILSIANIKQQSEFGQSIDAWRGNFALTNDEREIKKQYSLDSEDEYPETSFNEFGVGILFPILNAVYIKSNLSINWHTSIIADTYNNREYLSYDNKLIPIKESNIIELYGLDLTYSLETKLPIYGASIETEPQIISFYYLSLGLSGSLSIQSKANQYLQINNPKNNLRYNNGIDTVRIIDDRKLNSFDDNRFRSEIGIGIFTNVSEYYFDFLLTWSLPLNSILKDEKWMQHIFKLSVGIGF